MRQCSIYFLLSIQTYYQNIQYLRCLLLNFFPLKLYITHSSIYNFNMSIKWYEQHLEQIIRENQGLKYEAKKNKPIQSTSQEVAAVFKELFPDIPPMVSNNGNCTHELLQYYRKAAGKWLQKQRAKIQFLLHSSETEQTAALKLKGKKETVNKTVAFKQGNHDFVEKTGLQLRHQQDLIVKMDKMEKEIVQLKKEIVNFQKEQQKYIGQIGKLRSITKKLQFQLAQRLLADQKIKRSMVKQHERLQQKVAFLTKQTLTWRDQYERIWNQHQKQKNTLFHLEKCQEETLVNTSCKDDREHGEEENNQSNTWVIRGEDFEQSYIVDDRLDHSQISDFRVQRH